jgi:5-formyltetrahydrofolate cyclo-ligase
MAASATEIFALKSGLRGRILAASKAMCKNSIAWRSEQSEILCNRLWESPALAPLRSIEAQYIDTLSAMDEEGEPQQQQPASSASLPTVPSAKTPFCIGLYLSLWFEADVDPLLHRLLAVRELPHLIMQQRMEQLAAEQKGGSGSSGKASMFDDRALLNLPPAPRIFVPQLVQPVASAAGKAAGAAATEMQFVEILSAVDLQENFAPVPPFNIREPPRAEVEAAEKSEVGNRRRRLDGLTPDEPKLNVVIVPGVAFDFNANRLGKGGGYYDRWIGRSKATGSSTVFVGVGFDEQLPRASAAAEQKRSFWDSASAVETTASQQAVVPMVAGRDMPLDLVVTPHFSIGATKQ